MNGPPLAGTKGRWVGKLFVNAFVDLGGLQPDDACQRNISSRHPNFRFRHVDVVNPAYNPDGELDPVSFRFPYPDRAFDFVLLTSVFTHMLPAEVRHYLGEIRRAASTCALRSGQGGGPAARGSPSARTSSSWSPPPADPRA